MSAIKEDPNENHETIKVLFALYDKVDTVDVTGPLEVFHSARHRISDATSSAFECTLVGPSEHVSTRQEIVFRTQISFPEAHKHLAEFDVLVVPGGTTDAVLRDEAEPISLIKAFAAIQQANPARERTLFSVCTGSLLLAKAGVLQGLSATTHPDFDIKLEKLCQSASAHDSSQRTDVMQERYVVNNARFDLGDVDENPFVVSKQDMIQSHKERRRSSIARKGSNAWKESNSQRDSVTRRASMRLGGLRVITSGAVTSGIDAALYLVCAMVSEEAAHEVARVLQFTWTKGVVVNAIDI